MFRLTVDNEIELGLLEERHVQPFFELCVRNREHIREWQPWIEKIQEPEDALAFIRRSLKQLAENDGFQAGIFYKGKLAGNIGYAFWRWPTGATEIGYWLDRDSTGKGLAIRATRALVDYAFAELGLNRVVIEVNPRNLKSRAIPERLGFKQEAILRQVGFIKGGILEDLVVYGLLKEEWTGK